MDHTQGRARRPDAEADPHDTGSATSDTRDTGSDTGTDTGLNTGPGTGTGPGPGTGAGTARRMTRRNLVKGIAGGAAVGAVALASGAVSRDTAPGRAAGGADAKTADSVPPADVAAGQFVVHISDLKSGALDIYSGDRHMAVTDHEIATRLAYYTW